MGACGQSPDHFPSTSWSLVDRAAKGDDSASQPLAELLAAYWLPLWTHLARKGWGWSRDEIDDLIQGFIADKVLERDLIAMADRTRGKFRTYLATSLDRYVTSAHRKRRALKRYPTQGLREGAHHVTEIASDDDHRYDAYDVAWAQQVIDQALAEMKQACAQGGEEAVWRAFDLRVLRELFQGLDPAPYDQVMAECGFVSYGQATKALFRAKRKYIEHLRAVVGRYVTGPEGVDDEIHELRSVLASPAGKRLHRQRIPY